MPWADEEGYERIETPQKDVLWMGVLAQNRVALRVYQACQFTTGVGMAGLIWLGISAVEKRSALMLERIPRAAWEDVLRRVRVMERAALPVLNKPPKTSRGRKKSD